MRWYTLVSYRKRFITVASCERTWGWSRYTWKVCSRLGFLIAHASGKERKCSSFVFVYSLALVLLLNCSLCCDRPQNTSFLVFTLLFRAFSRATSEKYDKKISLLLYVRRVWARFSAGALFLFIYFIFVQRLNAGLYFLWTVALFFFPLFWDGVVEQWNWYDKNVRGLARKEKKCTSYTEDPLWQASILFCSVRICKCK